MGQPHWQHHLTERVRSFTERLPDVTLGLQHGVHETWNEWERLLNTLGRLGVRETSPLYLGYPKYGNPDAHYPSVLKLAAQWHLDVGRVLARPGTELDWETVDASLRFAGVVYYHFQQWPCLIVPHSFDWLVETYEVTQKTYVYLSASAQLPAVDVNHAWTWEVPAQERRE